MFKDEKSKMYQNSCQFSPSITIKSEFFNLTAGFAHDDEEKKLVSAIDRTVCKISYAFCSDSVQPFIAQFCCSEKLPSDSEKLPHNIHQTVF